MKTLSAPSTANGEQQSLERARMQIIRGDLAGAEAALVGALREFPRSFELRRALAGVFSRTQRHSDAENLLRELLHESPHDMASAFTLAQLLIGQARTHAAAEVIRACFDGPSLDPEVAIKAVEMLDQADRKADAAAVAEKAIAVAPQDPRLHAYAGMLQLQTGDFTSARGHYLFALEKSAQACEWHVPHGLAHAQRYADASHPDFELLQKCLSRNDLSEKARSTLLFALGKANDDVGEYAQAAACFRQANSLAHSLTRWSRKDWRRAVEARLAAKQPARPAAATPGFVPIFVVGMPRSGTTLLAELLSRYRQVCNRGELPWIAKLVQSPDLADAPGQEALQRTSEMYCKHARQDDALDAHWFIDKQPLNFRYVDLMLGMFPDAKVIFCQRNRRDLALSIWMQSFLEEVQGFAYDFADIQAVMRDSDRLAAHWKTRYPDSVRMVRYEDIVADSTQISRALAKWIGLPGEPVESAATTTISTASLWQARQPVYSRSVGRWKNYQSHVPELLQLPA